MTGSGEQSVVKRALAEIRDLRARLAAAETAQADRQAAARAGHDAVAITGIGLRLPGGVASLGDYERLLWSGRDAIGPIPENRWPVADYLTDDPDMPGKMTTRFGAFLDDVETFDPGFFGIAPEEARSLDPQQRLVLETCWEALEASGVAPASLKGTRTGVYLGIANSDYGRGILSDRDAIGTYFSTGTAFSVAAGRVSYVLGLNGPAISVDTACSASLVSRHLACQALRGGECDRALAGGVNVILTPEMNIAFSRGRMLAADGRCKTFDARADGYVRGEGCGIFALRRLSDARADGDPVLAVLRSSAVNQDGRSGGLTAPNGPAQEAVIRAALDAGRIDPADIAFVETHGTGTPLGDPIEIGALVDAYCRDRGAETPLLVTSAKTVVGHLEAAAGVAGAARAVLALRRRELPPHLNFETGNPEIDWSAPIRVATARTPLGAGGSDGAPLRAGVSSFGFSGTNAHVILEEAPEDARAEPAANGAVLVLPLSAQDPAALPALARDWAGALADVPAADLCRTAAEGRSHLRHRLAVTARDADGLRAGLRGYLDGAAGDAVAAGAFDGARRPRVAFLYSGQGGQYPRMARGLMRHSARFRAAIEQAAAALEDTIDIPLTDALFGDDAAAQLARTEIAQPALVAVQCALTGLWRDLGIAPAALLGHSLGELAAAHAAGVLSLDDAVRAAAARGKLLASLPAGGTMGSVSAPRAAIETEIAAHDGDLAIAAYNSPTSVTLSGSGAAMELALAHLSEQGARTKPVDVPFAAHSGFVEPVRDAMRAAMRDVGFRTATLPVISSVTGARIAADGMSSPEYWARNLRQPVLFDRALAALAETGATHVIEIGPHPVLLTLVAENDSTAELTMLPSLQRDIDDWTSLGAGLARLYADGTDPDWQALARECGASGRRVSAPTYPFQRRRHWIDLNARPRRAYWDAAAETLAVQSERGPLDLNAASYPAKWDCLSNLTAAVARQCLHDAGLFVQPGLEKDVDAVRAELGAEEIYLPLLRRWLDGLVARGTLRVSDGRYGAERPLDAPDLPALLDEAAALFADNRPLFDYVRHCAGLAGDVICGRRPALESLFPGGEFDLAQGLYERSATMRYINGLAGSVAQALAGVAAGGRKLQVLEIGAGTGGTSSSLLSRLPRGAARYVFTDVTDVFLDRGRERFGDNPDVVFRALDMEAPFAPQGFEPGSFDLIVSANAVHASRDLPGTLGRVRGLLRPGGLMMLIESTIHMDWFDFTTGLIEGWQSFGDDLRGDNPLLSDAQWRAALREAGFEDAGTWPAPESTAAALGQHIVLGRQAGDAVDAGATTFDSDEAGGSGPSRDTQLRAELEQAEDAERLDLLREHARAAVTRVLGRDAGDPPGRNDRLMDLGLDSLMALRLVKLLGQGLDLPDKLPASVAFDNPSVEALARFLHARLFDRDTAAATAATVNEPPGAGSPRAAPDATDLSGLSDDEVEAMLLERLKNR